MEWLYHLLLLPYLVECDSTVTSSNSTKEFPFLSILPILDNYVALGLWGLTKVMLLPVTTTIGCTLGCIIIAIPGIPRRVSIMAETPFSSV